MDETTQREAVVGGHCPSEECGGVAGSGGRAMTHDPHSTRDEWVGYAWFAAVLILVTIGPALVAMWVNPERGG